MTRLDRTIDRLHDRLADFIERWKGPFLLVAVCYIALYFTDAIVRNFFHYSFY